MLFDLQTSSSGQFENSLRIIKNDLRKPTSVNILLRDKHSRVMVLLSCGDLFFLSSILMKKGRENNV